MRTAERLVISRRRIDILQGRFDSELLIKKTVNDIAEVLYILSAVKIDIPDSVDRDSLSEIEQIFKKVFHTIKEEQPVYILSLVRSFLLDDVFSDFYINLLEKVVHIHSSKEVLMDLDFSDITTKDLRRGIDHIIKDSILFLRDRGFSIREIQTIMLNNFFIPLTYTYTRNVIVKNSLQRQKENRTVSIKPNTTDSLSHLELVAKNFSSKVSSKGVL